MKKAEPAENAQSYIEQGNKVLERKEFTEALQLFELALALEPENAEIYKCVGRVFDDQELYDEAAPYYYKAIELDPNYWAPYNNLGVMHSRQRNYEKAAEFYEKALELNPGFPGAVTQLAIAYSELKRHKLAQQYFNKAIELGKDLFYVRYHQACDFYLQKDYSRALFLFESFEAIPDDYLVGHYNNLAKTYSELKEYEKAIEYWKRVIELNSPDYQFTAHHNLAWIYEKLGQIDTAFLYCQKAAESKNNEFGKLNGFYYAFSYFGTESPIFQAGMKYLAEYSLAHSSSNLACHYLAMGYVEQLEFEKAIIQAKKAIHLDQSHPRSYYQLANAYFGVLEWENCLKALHKMLELDPLDTYKAHMALACVYKWQGKNQKAKKLESRFKALKELRKDLPDIEMKPQKGEICFSLFDELVP